MIGNLKPEENVLRTFTQTSDALYDKHDYCLISNDKKSVIFDNYYDVQQVWRSMPEGILSHVEVLDKKQPKTKNKGFS
jgi:hypothetical protein